MVLIDGTGAPIATYTYDPFGMSDVTGSGANSFQYTARESDAPTGLYYYRARYYHPRLHRFISEDPLGIVGGDVNLYAYVRNNPLGFIDRLGTYLSHVHGITTFVAMISKGYDPLTAAFVAGANIGSDFSAGSQRPENANWHSMATPDQSASQAQDATEQQIQSYLEPTGSPAVDFVNLGRALHASDDRFPAGHRGYQTWPGGFPSLNHILGDVFPSPRDFVNAIKAQRELIDRYQRLRQGPKKKG